MGQPSYRTRNIFFEEHSKRNYIIEQLGKIGITSYEGISIHELSYSDLKRILALRKCSQN